MNNAIVIGVAAFIIIVIGLVFVFPGHSTTASTVSTSNSLATTIHQQTTVPTVITTPHVNNTDCLSKNSTEPIYNGDFGTGAYAGWATNGLGFGSKPSNITYDDQYNEYYGLPWSGWNGTYFATSYSGGLSVAQGTLTSKTFLVTEPYLNFKIISPSSNQLFLQILSNNHTEVTVHYNTFSSVNNTNATNSNFENGSIILAPLLCRNVQIKVVAQVVGTGTNEFDYIAVTGFYMSKKAISTPGIIVNQSLNFT